MMGLPLRRTSGPCTSFLAPDAEGYMATQGGTEPVPVVVMPETVNWSGGD